MVRTYVKSTIYQYIFVATLCMALKKVCRTDACRTYFVKVDLHPRHHVSFEGWVRKIIRHVNTGGTYFKERSFQEFDAMPSVQRNSSSEMRNLFVGYIDDMKQHVGRNYQVWTRYNIKYLVKYVLLKHIDNNFISYYFSNENTQVIDHVYAYTIADGVYVFSGSEEEQEEEQDQDQHDYAIEGADDNDDENYPKGESSSATWLALLTLSPIPIFRRLLFFHKIYWIISKLK